MRSFCYLPPGEVRLILLRRSGVVLILINTNSVVNSSLTQYLSLNMLITCRMAFSCTESGTTPISRDSLFPLLELRSIDGTLVSILLHRTQIGLNGSSSYRSFKGVVL